MIPSLELLAFCLGASIAAGGGIFLSHLRGRRYAAAMLRLAHENYRLTQEVAALEEELDMAKSEKQHVPSTTSVRPYVPGNTDTPK